MSKKASDSWIMAKHFNLDSMVTLLDALLEQSSDEDISNGLAWYQDCNDFARALSKKTGRKLSTVIGVISALSPRTDISQNLIDAQNLILLGNEASCSTYDSNKDKALRILSGGLNAHEHFIDKWAKTGAFYRNILRPHEDYRITLDAHATRVIHGYHMSADEAIAYVSTPAKYYKSEEAYTRVAKHRAMRPHDIQAIAWITYRKLFVTGKRKDLDFDEIIL